jgi:hypothetical protein
MGLFAFAIGASFLRSGCARLVFEQYDNQDHPDQNRKSPDSARKKRILPAHFHKAS